MTITLVGFSTLFVPISLQSPLCCYINCVHRLILKFQLLYYKTAPLIIIIIGTTNYYVKITVHDHNAIIISNNNLDIIACHYMTEGDVPPVVNNIAMVEMGVRNPVEVIAAIVVVCW